MTSGADEDRATAWLHASTVLPTLPGCCCRLWAFGAFAQPDLRFANGLLSP